MPKLTRASCLAAILCYSNTLINYARTLQKHSNVSRHRNSTSPARSCSAGGWQSNALNIVGWEQPALSTDLAQPPAFVNGLHILDNVSRVKGYLVLASCR